MHMGNGNVLTDFVLFSSMVNSKPDKLCPKAFIVTQANLHYLKAKVSPSSNFVTLQ